MLNTKRNYVRGFTLAEVLITLGIIGVVAALTIPTLRQAAQERSTITAVKKMYSTLENSFRIAVNDNGTPDNWNLIANGSGTGAANMLNVLAPYLKLDQNCGTANGCFPNVMYTLFDKTDDDNYYSGGSFGAKARLQDGTSVFFMIRNPTCSNARGTSLSLSNVCGLIMADINGNGAPNQNGRDMFSFIVTKYGIIPQGSAQETYRPFNTNCRMNVAGSGLSCTAWIIYQENMDYLRCNNLDWGGPTTCP